MNQNNRERIQAILPRIINSVICQITDKKKGIGKLKIGLFGRPFDRGENAELWNKTLQKIADECYNKKVLEENSGKFGTKAYKKREVSSCGGAPVDSGKRYYNAQCSQEVTLATPCFCFEAQPARGGGSFLKKFCL